MRKVISNILVLIVSLMLFASCAANSNVEDNSSGIQITATPEITEEAVMPEEGQPSELKDNTEADVITLNIYSYTEDVTKVLQMYLDTHPDFAKRYQLNYMIYGNADAYDMFLASELVENKTDIIIGTYPFFMKYIQGEYSNYTASYKDFGIDIDKKVAAAELAPYSVEMGIRPSDGEIVALSYEATSCAFLYRRSIATDTWGSDDPDFVAEKIGAGTNGWDAFLNAASELSEKGYATFSGIAGLWRAYSNSAGTAWVMDGKLNIDPECERFADFYKEIRENNYDNGTEEWQDEWFAELHGGGDRQVFSFYAPVWFIQYVLTGNCGDTFGDWAICEPNVNTFWGGDWILGTKNAAANPKKAAGIRELLEWLTLDTTEDGLQYLWANGKTDASQIIASVTSNRVLKQCDGKLDILGGQDIFDIYPSINQNTYGCQISAYDEWINMYWLQQVHEYALGNKSYEEALKDFKKIVDDIPNITVE